MRRASGSMPSEVPVVLQRGGLAAGLDAVAKWHRAAVRNERAVGYWQNRVDNAGASPFDDAGEYAAARLSRVTDRRDRHLERAPHDCSGPANS